jgi:hypothetical protein
VNTTNPVMVVPETEIARATGIEPTYTLPSMPNACYAAVSRGVPIVDLSAQLPAAQTFTTMAAAIVSRPWMLTRAHAVSSTESAEAVEAR